jgi:hypothetical protein
VRFSGRHRLVVAAVLALTVGLKAASTRAVPAPDVELFASRAEALLQDAGFRTGRTVRPFGTVLFGRRGDCTLMVADYLPQGTFAEPIGRLGQSAGPLLYYWRGGIGETAPRLGPLIEYYIGRELRRVGFSPPRHPILALAGSQSCDLVAMDWTSLAALPR